MKKQSLSLKVTIIYIFLAVLNILFFSIMIYENQMDLIKENVQYKAEKMTGELLNSLQKASEEVDSKIFNLKDKSAVVGNLVNMINKVVPEFVFFNAQGGILYRSHENIVINNDDILKGNNAITNKEFTGKRFYSSIDEKSYVISFYIPAKFPYVGEFLLLFRYQMKEINQELKNLYLLITLLIIVIAIIHVLFAFFLYRLVIRPIQKLHRKSMELAGGKYSARVQIMQNDELGSLGYAFNSMAASIEQKIDTLERRDEIMRFELNVANQIQKIIYPKKGSLEKIGRFKFGVFHQALVQVSGDYYDVFPLDDERYGFLIVDVSGHGVPAALITMIAKEKFKLYAPQIEDPAELFRTINDEMLILLEDYNAFFTAFYLVLDGKNNSRFCNAGHQRTYFFKASTGEVGMLDTSGALIGMMKEANKMYTTREHSFSSGDKFVLFTDGIVEAMNEERQLYGEERLSAVIKAYGHLEPDALVAKILEDLSRFKSLDKLHDDATLFVVEIK